MVSVKAQIEQLIKRLLWAVGYDIRRIYRANGELYAPMYSPWLGEQWFEALYTQIEEKTLLSREKCYVLNRLSLQSLSLQGDFAECGVYKGGSALLIAETIKQRLGERLLHLFDTFEGMPEPDPNRDDVVKGEMADTSLEEVTQLLADYPFVSFHKGLLPTTFKDVTESNFCFAHIDVDIYQSVWDCCDFFYPRTNAGGIWVFDDYGFPTCQGAKQAVDEFFSDKREVPLCLHTGQCIILKLKD